VYADDFIAVHLKEIGGGKTCSQLSAEAMAEPDDSALATQVNIIFKGTTLRGLLLNAYAFSIFGEIALVAAVAALVLGVALALLAILGFLHYRRTPASVEFPATQ
jgi:hypothetical protein